MKSFKFFIRKFKYSRKNSLLLGMIVLLCFGVTVGYAFLKTTLEIDGALKVAGSTWDIHFENIQIKSGSVTATTAPTITDDTTISFAATLENPGDYYEFTADIVNDGTYDAKLDSLNLVPTLTSAQQEYFNYSVTYYDDLPIQTNDALDAGTSEKIKVVYQYKTNADSSKYPEEDVNFSPEITMNYVQGSGNDVEHPITMYGVYHHGNKLTINQAVPSTTILRSTVGEALADWQTLIGSEADPKPYYFRHIIVNNIVKETYLEFIVTDEMAQDNPGLVAGTYSIRGGIDESSDSEKPVWEANKDIIKEAYGYATNPSRCTENSTDFSCIVNTPTTLRIKTSNTGIANGYDGSWFCGTNTSANSYCIQ